MPAGDRKLTMDELGRIAPEAYADQTRRPVVVVLDDVRSRHNVGSIFRTADSFGIERLVLCGFTPQPPHREIEKTALGATLSVPWSTAEDTVTAIRDLQQQGYTVVAVEQTLSALPLITWNPAPDARIALVLGNELHGVSDTAVEACDLSVVIPQGGSKHSLNVSVCAGVVLWWLAGRFV
ncbi:MAG: RNA methyltransferase [Flavobacteriales bacterium]|nr:RNA methyltransferase [Flavobacteriales bacterium]MBK9286518.1 RNA methyltransferase [Flavobacteriales bacterium]